MTAAYNISLPYLEQAAVQEFADQLASQGFEVTQEAMVGDVRVDLVAERNGKKTFYEFKLFSSASQRIAPQIAHIQRIAREHDADFKLIVVRPPRPKVIEFDRLEELLEDYFRENVPHEVADIAGGTLVDEVADVEISSLSINGNEAVIEGDASLGVTLTTGAGEPIDSLGFPMTFTAIVDLHERVILEAHVTDLDDSVWYGYPDERD